MVDLLQREVYGYLPEAAYSLCAGEPKTVEKRYACGMVVHSYIDLTVNLKNGSHTFRVDRLLHNDGKKRPLVLLNNFHPMGSSPYFPIEELSETETDFLVFCYTDITSDDGDFSTGLAHLLLRNGNAYVRSTCGKIYQQKEKSGISRNHISLTD